MDTGKSRQLVNRKSIPFRRGAIMRDHECDHEIEFVAYDPECGVDESYSFCLECDEEIDCEPDWMMEAKEMNL